MSQSEHISRRFDSDLDALLTKVLQMGGLVERQAIDAVRSFSQGDFAGLDQVLVAERSVNEFERAIDDDCAQIIARRQPAASDLRLLFSIAKTVTDLERVGDEAHKIARMAKQILERERVPMPQLTDVTHCADRAVSMLRRALDAYARRDTREAGLVIREDSALDSEFRSVLRQLVTFMMEDPRTISTALDIVWIAKAAERIGDHAKNIAQYVIYIAEGTDVRHRKAGQHEVANEDASSAS